MPGSAAAEIYFIVAMMVLILVVSGAAVYFFVRQYKKEMRAKSERSARDAATRNQFSAERDDLENRESQI